MRRIPHQHSSARPLALAYAVLVVYGSLYPFDFNWPPGTDLLRLLRLPWPPWLIRFDIATNLIGYLPLGALLCGARLRGGGGVRASVFWAVLSGSALSYTMEVLQSFVPLRVPSLIDWTFNSLGALAGALLAAGIDAQGWVDRWQATRERWFVRQSAGALALLSLWPVALLFPAPVPLGLGQVAELLREGLLEQVQGVPWAAGAQALLADPWTLPQRLAPVAEGMVSALGLLAPCLVAYSVAPPGWRRALLALAAFAIALGMLTLSTLFSFGPDHALAWLTPGTLPALGFGLALAVLLAPAPPRLAAGLGLVVLAALVTLVAQAPADPYFAQNLQAWEQGRFIRFHGLAQWVGLLWPFAAMVWLLARLGAED